MLHDAAKDDPTAQRVFVETWETGRLDAGLENLSDADWDLVLPWFREQYKKGRRKGGLVLGNEAYRVKKYKDAEKYWRAAGEAGLAKAKQALEASVSPRLREGRLQEGCRGFANYRNRSHLKR